MTWAQCVVREKPEGETGKKKPGLRHLGQTRKVDLYFTKGREFKYFKLAATMTIPVLGKDQTWDSKIRRTN